MAAERIAAELAGLEDLSSARLRARWTELTGGPVPRVSAAMLRLALAWEIQARAQGGLPRAVTAALDQQARGLTRTQLARPGTRLVREWQGKVHLVTIEERGGGDDGAAGSSSEVVIRWDGREWRSLSEVARAITGTRWSGPAFFGLKLKAAA